MIKGIALENTVTSGAPDFPGMGNSRGQTMSPGPDAVMIDVMKCKECGYSISG